MPPRTKPDIGRLAEVLALRAASLWALAASVVFVAFSFDFGMALKAEAIILGMGACALHIVRLQHAVRDWRRSTLWCCLRPGERPVDTVASRLVPAALDNAYRRVGDLCAFAASSFFLGSLAVRLVQATL
jgi:hypothetical protein